MSVSERESVWCVYTLQMPCVYSHLFLMVYLVFGLLVWQTHGTRTKIKTYRFTTIQNVSNAQHSTSNGSNWN